MTPALEKLGAELTAAMAQPVTPPLPTASTWRRARRMGRALYRSDASGEAVRIFLQVALPIFEAQEQRNAADGALMRWLQERAAG